MSNTVKSKATSIGLDNVSGSIDAFRQGVHVRGFNDLLNHTTFKIRSNSSFVRTVNGRDIPENSYDDSIATANFSGVMTAHSTTAATSASISQVSIGGDHRLGQRLTHIAERRDLGQSEYYIDDFFIDQPQTTGHYIVATHPIHLVVPERVVDASDASSMDGVIEPLDIRRIADHSSIEMPYVARSIKGSIAGEEDKFKHVSLITDEVELEEISNPQTVWFLDSVEHMGILDIPGIQNVNKAKIVPFNDTVDSEATVQGLQDAEIRGVLMKANYTDDDAKVHELTARRGFVFHNSETGYDSIAYGGLKK